jgi:hypothetical protein
MSPQFACFGITLYILSRFIGSSKPFFSVIAFTSARWIQQALSHKNGKASEFFTEIPKVISKFLSSGIGNGLVHCFVRVQELKEKEIMI